MDRDVFSSLNITNDFLRNKPKEGQTGSGFDAVKKRLQKKRESLVNPNASVDPAYGQSRIYEGTTARPPYR